jgi:hypothetical protein
MSNFNLDDLKKINKEKKKLRENNYNKILQLIYNKIKLVNGTGGTECYYLVPQLIGSHTIGDMSDCIKYLGKKLEKHKFDEMKIYKPNMVYVKWSID